MRATGNRSSIELLLNGNSVNCEKHRHNGQIDLVPDAPMGPFEWPAESHNPRLFTRLLNF